MLTKEEFIEFILKGPQKGTATVAAIPDHAALPEGFEGFEVPEAPITAPGDTSTFARRLLEASGFGYPELVGRNTVIRSTDAVARYLPDRVSFWPKTPSRPYQTLLFETPLTHRQLLEIPAFRARKMNHLDIVEDAVARLVSESLEGFQRGGESVTADVRKGRKEETLCVISIVDEREGEPVHLVCFGTQNKTTDGLETFQITERTRFWDGALAREHLGLVYERQFKKLSTENWQEAFTTTEERKQAEKLVEICTRKTPKEVDIQEGVLDLLDTIAKGFGLRRKPNTERRLQAFALPPDHDIGIDPEERASIFGGRNPFGGVTLRDERNRLLGYIVYPLATKGDATRLRKHLQANNRFHNVLVVYPDQDEANFELWQGREELVGKLRKGQGFRNAAEIVNLLSRFFVVSKAKVRNPTELAQELAYRARYLRRLAVRQLEEEPDNGSLRNLYNAFKQALVHDQTEEEFADAFAQTVTYGLLTARWIGNDQLVSAGERFTRLTAIKHLPPTSPFLTDLFKSVLAVKFDEQRGRLLWLVDDMSDLLDRIDVSFVFGVGDAGAETATDPVIHFYEPFLAAYDKELKNKRGVFFTPKAVVSYIVRSVHELLQKEFGLEDGLASTDTWGDVIQRRPGMLELPDGIKTSDPFVCVLDPATGTGTFLFECIELIEYTVKEKCCRELKKTSWEDPAVVACWTEYVTKDLLPRLYGYELMMASYAVAHLKLSFKLAESGYHIRPDDRLRIFLTNSLEPPSDTTQGKIAGTFPALAHEALAVNAVKRHRVFTIVIGNPPYSRVSQNSSAFIQKLLRDYKEPVSDEANQQPLDDDYIKFIRLAHHLQSNAKCGIIGYITNHTVISGILFRGVRQRLLEDQSLVFVLDLHGNSNIKEKCPDGSKDENVFDIQAGVAVTIAARIPWQNNRKCMFRELWGLRQAKYEVLERLSIHEVRESLEPTAPYFFLKPIDLSAGDELKGAFSLPDIFPVYSSGLMTVRDNLAIAFDRNDLHARFEAFRAANVSDSQFQAICPVKDYRTWSMSGARKKVRADKHWEEHLKVVNYRPFDKRWIYYSPDIITYPNFRVMDQFKRRNIGLISSRIHKGEEHAHEFVSREMVEIIFLSSKSSNNAFLFPLYAFDGEGALALKKEGSPNFGATFLKQLSANLGLSQNGSSGLPEGITPDDIFQYIYAVLHSPGYRSRYAEFLKFEFPRVPLTSNLKLFRALIRLGGEIIPHHLLESPKLPNPVTAYVGPATPTVEKISYARDTVWLDRAQTQGFQNVPEAIWNFHIGGYQVCEKWLKDRKGRSLSKDEIVHYRRIVAALTETNRLMNQIDQLIDRNGGWPEAFEAKLPRVEK